MLPGKTLEVGLAIWFEVGCKNTRSVAVTLARLARLGMTAKTARRACQELERAGLISVARSPGRALAITLNDMPVRT